MATPFEICYSTSAIRSVNSSGTISTLSLTSTDSVYIAKGGIGEASGFCSDSAGNVYVGDVTHHVVWKIAPSGVVTRVAGTGSSGNTGDGGAATSAKIGQPGFLAVDASGNVYFIDTDYYIVRCVNTQATTQVILGISIGAGQIEIVAGISGEFGNTGNGGAATLAKISADGGIAVDPSGNLWMGAPDSFHVVRQVNSSTGVITVAVGTGTGGSTGDGGPYYEAELDGPAGLAFDAVGNLYIADNYAYRIRAVNLGGTPRTILGVSIDAGDINTVAGTGTQGPTGDGGPAVDAELGYPLSLALDPSGNLYLSDTLLVRMVNALGVISTVAGTGVAGSGPDGGLAVDTEIGGTHGADISVVIASPAANISVSPSSLQFYNMVWNPALPSEGSGAPGFGTQNPQGLSITASGAWTCTSSSGMTWVNQTSGSGNATVVVGISADFVFPKTLNYTVNRTRSGTYVDTLTIASGGSSVQVPITYYVGYGDNLDGPLSPHGNPLISHGIVVQPPPA